MMIEVLGRLLEYVGIILCLHAFAKVEREINLYNATLCVLNIGIHNCIDKYSNQRVPLVLFLYLLLFLYVKLKLEKTWFEAIKIWGIMMVSIPSLQLGLYIVMKMCFKATVSDRDASIIANVLIGILFYFWNEKSFALFVSKIRKKVWGIVAITFISIIVYLGMIYKIEQFVQAEVMLQMVGVIWGLIILLVIVLTAEIERRNKERELKLYQVYNKSFEDAVITIRQRQHEFNNHINAIKCMHYMIHDTKDLIDEQNRYCDSLLKENELNSLLKQDLEPIVISVLYTKLLAAQGAGIEVSQKVHVIDFKKRIEVIELVEIIGILIDNAVEALATETRGEKKLRVRILSEADKHFSIEVANSCEVLLQSEIEKFTESGYSTKGTNRGVGLARLKVIAKRNNAEISMGNAMYEGQNYFRVRMLI